MIFAPRRLKIACALKPKFWNESMNEWKKILGFKLCTEAENFFQRRLAVCTCRPFGLGIVITSLYYWTCQLFPSKVHSSYGVWWRGEFGKQDMPVPHHPLHQSLNLLPRDSMGGAGRGWSSHSKGGVRSAGSLAWLLSSSSAATWDPPSGGKSADWGGWIGVTWRPRLYLGSPALCPTPWQVRQWRVEGHCFTMCPISPQL